MSHYRVDQTSMLKLILHIGTGLNVCDSDILQEVSKSGGVGEHVTLIDGSQKAIRAEFFGSLSLVKELRLSLMKKYPGIRLKVIPSGEVVDRKIYVKIHPSHTRSMITDHFKQFGSLKKVELKYDTKNSRFRNFCYVTFSEESGAAKAAEQQHQMLGNKYIICERCKPYKISPEGLTHPISDEESSSSKLPGTSTLASNKSQTQYDRASVSSSTSNDQNLDHGMETQVRSPVRSDSKLPIKAAKSSSPKTDPEPVRKFYCLFSKSSGGSSSAGEGQTELSLSKLGQKLSPESVKQLEKGHLINDNLRFNRCSVTKPLVPAKQSPNHNPLSIPVQLL